MAAVRRRAVDVPQVLAVSDDRSGIPGARVDRRGPAGPSTEPDLGRHWPTCTVPALPASGARTGAPRGAADSPTSRRRHGPSSTRCNRLLPLAKLASDAGALPTASIERLEALAGRLDAVGGPPTAGPAPRRPVGRQPAGRRRWTELADRSRCPRRAPRVRPGDDAPVRRFRRRLLRRLRRRVPARRRLGGTRRRSTRSLRSSCTPSSSAAATPPAAAAIDRYS